MDPACANKSESDIGISRFDKEAAEKLPNRTTLIPGDEDYYIVGLDVMHQLHCLNRLRKTLYPDRYHVFANLTGGDLTLGMDHIGLFLRCLPFYSQWKLVLTQIHRTLCGFH
jgi:hypothetical protein